MSLTASRARELLDYNPETGVFTWKVKASSRAMPGDLAGSLTKQGYWRVHVDGCAYKAHRLAWLHVHGEWPSQHIDHINGDKLDNRIANLRDVSLSVNQENRRAAEKGAASKLLGVCWASARQTWQAQICVRGRRMFLGYFKTEHEAHSAYLAAKRELHAGNTL